MMQLPITISRFETVNVLGGQFLLSQIGMDLAKFLREADEGRLHTPEGMIVVPRSETPDFMTPEFKTEFSRLAPEGVGIQQRTTKLILNAGPGHHDAQAHRTELDWEVRAADTPFDGLADLAAALGLAPANLDKAFVMATAPAPAAIDAAHSRVMGGQAVIVCRLATSLSPDEFTLGYRIVKIPITTVNRATIPGANLKWEPSESPHFNSGAVSIEVPEGAVVQCFANIRGVLQHFYWIADPNVFLNPL